MSVSPRRMKPNKQNQPAQSPTGSPCQSHKMTGGKSSQPASQEKRISLSPVSNKRVNQDSSPNKHQSSPFKFNLIPCQNDTKPQPNSILFESPTQWSKGVDEILEGSQSSMRKDGSISPKSSSSQAIKQSTSWEEPLPSFSTVPTLFVGLYPAKVERHQTSIENKLDFNDEDRAKNEAKEQNISEMLKQCRQCLTKHWM